MKLDKSRFNILYAFISIVVIVLIPILYDKVYNSIKNINIKNAFVSAEIVAISPAYVSGHIKKIYAKNKNTVKKGQMIALIDDGIYKANLDKDISRLEAAEFRLKQFRISNPYSTQYETFKKDINVLEKEARISQLMLSYTRITAPFDAVVASVVLHKGDFVQPGKTIMYIYRPETLYIKAYIDRSLVKYIKIGMKVKVKPYNNMHSMNGTIQNIGTIELSNTNNQNKNLVPIAIKIDKKYRNSLRIGLPVAVYIIKNG